MSSSNIQNEIINIINILHNYSKIINNFLLDNEDNYIKFSIFNIENTLSSLIININKLIINVKNINKSFNLNFNNTNTLIYHPSYNILNIILYLKYNLKILGKNINYINNNLINPLNLKKHITTLIGDKYQDYPYGICVNPETNLHKNNREYICCQFNKLELLPLFDDCYELSNTIDISNTIDNYLNTDIKSKYEYTPTEINTKEITIYNYCAYIKGTEFPDKYIMYSSHYDAADEFGPTQGAADPISSVSVGLELARLFKKNPPKTSVIITFFDAEERGLLGAKLFVDSLKKSHINPTDIIFSIWCDNLSGNFQYDDDVSDIIFIDGGIHMKPIFNMENFKNNLSSLIPTALLTNIDSFVVGGVGDNIVLTLQGLIPTIFIGTLGSLKTWHTANDTLENLDILIIAKIAQTIYEELKNISNKKIKYFVPNELNYKYSSEFIENTNKIVEYLNNKGSELYNILIRIYLNEPIKDININKYLLAILSGILFGCTDINSNLSPLPRELKDMLSINNLGFYKIVYDLLINLVQDETDKKAIEELKYTDTLIDNARLNYNDEELLEIAYTSYDVNNKNYNSNIIYDITKISRLRYWFSTLIIVGFAYKYKFDDLLPDGFKISNLQPGYERGQNINFNNSKNNFKITIGCGCCKCWECE